LRAGGLPSRSGFAFSHGAEYKLTSGITLIASYHPSLQNTNTGKLTRTMFLQIFMRARHLAALGRERNDEGGKEK
jgi:uracil-DNA glycosylase